MSQTTGMIEQLRAAALSHAPQQGGMDEMGIQRDASPERELIDTDDLALIAGRHSALAHNRGYAAGHATGLARGAAEGKRAMQRHGEIVVNEIAKMLYSRAEEIAARAAALDPRTTKADQLAAMLGEIEHIRNIGAELAGFGADLFDV